MASEEETEAQFVARLVARDEGAFNELVVTYERRVFALVFRMLGRRDEAEDLSQEVFVQVFKAIDQFRGDFEALDLDLPDRRQPLQKPLEVPVAPPRRPAGRRRRDGRARPVHGC
ncbi:MAG: sigma factor [Minicystis sp.]